MNERPTDFELLRAFVQRNDQEAFATTVRRHLDLVFATALRKLGDAGAAEEAAQNVFTVLARKAWQLAPDDSLPAWLYRTTLLETKEWWRGELRRRRREQTAAELGTTMKTPEEQSAFRTLVPLLDDALLSLREKDRTALLLRFYERQSLREIGTALGVGEDAAQKRVAAALEKLADFFRRRGFKTATAAATSAALQHTAVSASGATASAIISAALQSAPVLSGVSAPLARLAGLSKAQTAALCVALCAVPVTWQLHQHRTAGQAATRMKTRLAEVQTERANLQLEIQRLRAVSARLNDSIAAANATANRAAVSAEKFEDWKAKIRAELLGDKYSWPTDSSFVRIPKSALKKIAPDQTVLPPGVLSQESRELLGLTPEERKQIEAALQAHFSTMNSLIAANLYVTNQATGFSGPKDALASKIWAVPALGDELKASNDALETSLQSILGPDRWALVSDQMQSWGTDTLRRILGLDADLSPQWIGAWITEKGGKFFVGFGWSGFNASFTSGAGPLEAFQPGAAVAPDGANPGDFLGSRNLPEALTRPVTEWIRQQAINRQGTEAAQ